MKLETVQRDVSHAGMMEVAKATIAPSKKIFDIFSDQIYSDKPRAILRELVANGIDAHVMAGCPERPVEVVLPTELDPTCLVRDFGTGMAHDFVMTKFMAYSDASTKDQDNGQIGGFGVGSKAPLSYVDAFTLRVVHDGVLSVYTLFKGEDGIPAIGLQTQITTDEANGCEFSFPVEVEDVQKFHEAAQVALEFFYPVPTIINGSINEPDYTYRGAGWAIRKSHGPLNVILGGIRYPVNIGALEWSLRNDERLKDLLNYGVDITMPIGAVPVAMSREALGYTPKTSAAIKERLEEVIDQVVSTFATLFDDCDTEWDAMKMLYSEGGGSISDYSRTARAKLILANAKWQGMPLKTSFPVHGKFWDIKVAEVASRRKTKRVTSFTWKDLQDQYSITPGDIEEVIIDDIEPSPKYKAAQRLREYVETKPQQKTILILRGKDVPSVVHALRGCQDYTLASSLPMPAPKVKGAKNVRPRVRMFTFSGEVDRWTRTEIRNLKPADSKQDIVKEVLYADQPATGVAVVMESFDLPADFHHKMTSGLVKFDELRFVNRGDWEKIKNNWQLFDDVFKDRLAKALAAAPDLPTRLALANESAITSNYRRFNRIYESGQKLTPAQANRPFGRLYSLWTEHVRTLTTDERKLAPFVKAQLPKGKTPEQLDKEIAPKLQWLLNKDDGSGIWLELLFDNL